MDVVYIMDADGSNVAKLTDGHLKAEDIFFGRQALHEIKAWTE